MATISGTLNYILVEDNYCCVSVATTTGTSYATLWSFFVETPTAAAKVTHNQWLNVCRDALLNTKDVTITTDSGDSLVTSIRINA